MTDAPNDRMGMIERGVALLGSLSLSNLLMMALILVLTMPSYFAWKFMQDTEFRHEFLSTSRVVSVPGVNCIVILGNLTGSGDKYMVGTIYATEGLEEHFISVRMPFSMSNTEIQDGCAEAHKHADILKAALAQNIAPRQEE